MTIEEELFTCNDCGGGFKSEGYLKLHRERKHGEVVKPHKCNECDKILQSKRNLEDHVKKLHRTCKQCDLTFEIGADLLMHKKVHTTCSVCSIDMVTKYRLERHLKTHK